jgi:hypothetical protein
MVLCWMLYLSNYPVWRWPSWHATVNLGNTTCCQRERSAWNLFDYYRTIVSSVETQRRAPWQSLLTFLTKDYISLRILVKHTHSEGPFFRHLLTIQLMSRQMHRGNHNIYTKHVARKGFFFFNLMTYRYSNSLTQWPRQLYYGERTAPPGLLGHVTV